MARRVSLGPSCKHTDGGEVPLTHVQNKLLSLHPHGFLVTTYLDRLARLQPRADRLREVGQPAVEALVEVLCQLDRPGSRVLGQIYIYADLPYQPGEVHHVLYYGTVRWIQERRVRIEARSEFRQGKATVMVLFGTESAWTAHGE